MVLNLTETEKAYIAGIIDGEGSISIIGNGSGRSFCLVVGLSNTSLELMEYLSTKFGKKVYESKYIIEGHKKMYQLQISGIEAKKLLKQIVPYLIVKKERAELGLEHPCGEKGGKRRLTDKERLDQAINFILFKELNKRGA